jgi:hypothetical protein
LVVGLLLFVDGVAGYDDGKRATRTKEFQFLPVYMLLNPRRPDMSNSPLFNLPYFLRETDFSLVSHVRFAAD